PIDEHAQAQEAGNMAEREHYRRHDVDDRHRPARPSVQGHQIEGHPRNPGKQRERDPARPFPHDRACRAEPGVFVQDCQHIDDVYGTDHGRDGGEAIEEREPTPAACPPERAAYPSRMPEVTRKRPSAPTLFPGNRGTGRSIAVGQKRSLWTAATENSMATGRVTMRIPRRNLLKGVAGIALMLPWGAKALAGAGVPAFRRVRPTDPGWPSAADWQALNDAVGDSLVEVKSLFGVCQSDAAGAACTDALKNIRNPFYIGDQPSGTQVGVAGRVDARAKRLRRQGKKCVRRRRRRQLCPRSTSAPRGEGRRT